MTEQPGRHRSASEEAESQHDSVEQVKEDAESPAELDRIHRERDDVGRPPPRWKALLLTPSNGVWAGLAAVAAGFSAIFYSWGAVAGTLYVDEQMSSLTLSGFVGLGLVVVGIAAVDIAVRRQDRPERMQQVAQVDRSVAELRDFRAGLGSESPHAE